MRLPTVIFFALMLLIFVLAGCSTPVTQKFPEVPPRLLVKCPNLQKLEQDPQLSDVAKTITINYTTYYECAVKNDGWIEWYQIQKNIFEEAYK